MMNRELNGTRMQGWAWLTAGLVLACAGNVMAIELGTSCRVCHVAAEPGGTGGATSRPAQELSKATGPDKLILDMLAGDQAGTSWFDPVSFNHSGHAGMTGDCATCHHHTPEGETPAACRTCHEPRLLREDITKPSLKGAYHRQCLGCHREWSHEDHCAACHALNQATPIRKTGAPPPQYMGHEHPAVTAPDIKQYPAKLESGRMSTVVFRHQEHIARYGNNCVDCHRSDNCARCHAANPPHVPIVLTKEEPHRACASCHVVDDQARCGFCHLPEGTAVAKSFDHAQTGWPLAAYHQERNCRDCHRQAPFGQLATDCSSCHPVPAAGATAAERQARGISRESAHAAWYGYIRNTSSGELCLRCHQDYARGAHAGKHPMTLGQTPLPAALIEAGAQSAADASKPACLACHSTATLQFAPITLANATPDGLCLACHPQQASIAGTVHDVRLVDERGTGTTTAPSGGTCRTCHLVHGTVRAAAPTKGDPTGTCTACHQPHAWGQGKSAVDFVHAKTACTDCHNPHEARFGQFLARPAAELCTQCHKEQAHLAGGGHDPSRHPQAWPDPVAATKGPCLACHVPHGGSGRDLLRFPATNADAPDDAACLACHAKTAWGSKGDLEILHPHEISPTQDKINRKRVPKDSAGRQRMTCQTCHDPHAGAKPAYLTRGAPDQPAGLCLSCHQQKQLMERTGHSVEKLKPLGVSVNLCQPCHAMHAKREEAWGQMLSPRFLTGKDVKTVHAGEGAVPCLACHHPKGPAPMPTVAVHPRVVLPNIIDPKAPGYLPLFDATGHESRDGQITCHTCHLSHGRLDLLSYAEQNQKMSEQDRHMMRLNLRYYAEPNFCTECHGETARLRFLRFHNEAKREELRQK